jgi:preprotein translocase subunit YajC
MAFQINSYPIFIDTRTGYEMLRLLKNSLFYHFQSISKPDIMLRNIRFIVLIFTLFSVHTFAQNQSSSSTAKKKSRGYEMLAYGATTNTNSGLLGGLVVRHSSSVGLRRGKPLYRYIAIEAINIKHPKERSEPTGIASRFIYGKTNYLFSIRPQYGREIVYFKKNDDNGIGISLIVAGGPSIGIQKPYYIKYDRTGRGQVDIVQFDPNIHKELNRIQGSAGIWQYFFKSMRINPGLHLKVAANIDMNTFGNSLTGFEVGLTAEAFSKQVEILSSQLAQSPQFYTAGFLTIYFGSKKQKK